MNVANDDDALVFSNEPLLPSGETVTLSILSRENVLSGDEHGTGSTQKTVVEGRITFNPRGRIFFIPPTESDQSILLVPDRKKWDLYLVNLPFTLHELSGNRYYELLKFAVRLTMPDALAFVLFPKKVDNEMEAVKTYCFSPSVEFQEFEAGQGQRGRQIRFQGLRPMITSFGENESEFYWIHKGYAEPKRVIPETKQALVVLQVPYGTPSVDGTVSGNAVIAEEALGEWEQKDGFVQEYPIHWELQGVPLLFPGDTAQIRPPDGEGHDVTNGVETLKVFCSYAPKDQKLMERLAMHLRGLEPRRVSVWYAQNSLPGTDEERERDGQLHSANVILFLVSPDFISSREIQEKEVSPAMERYERGETHVVPIILYPVHWRTTVFGSLRPLPDGGKPVTSWSRQDDAFFNVVDGIERVIQEIVGRGEK